MKITKRQLKRIIKEEILNEQGRGNPLNSLAAAVQDLVDDGVSLWDFQERLPSYGFDDTEVMSSPISMVTVHVGGQKLVIVPSSAAEPGPNDHVVGKYVVGVME